VFPLASSPPHGEPRECGRGAPGHPDDRRWRLRRCSQGLRTDLALATVWGSWLAQKEERRSGRALLVVYVNSYRSGTDPYQTGTRSHTRSGESGARCHHDRALLGVGRARPGGRCDLGALDLTRSASALPARRCASRRALPAVASSSVTVQPRRPSTSGWCSDQCCPCGPQASLRARGRSARDSRCCW
jgi:hypothetical protein